jgi:lysozyme
MISERGRELIRAYERLRLTGYLCPAGIPTIGWGHTGPDVEVGQRITLEHAEELFALDVAIAERTVRRLVQVPINENQLAALASFVFNVGTTAFASSTLLRRLNAQDYAGAAAQFERWNMGTVGGKKVVLRGLTRRRAEERALFLLAPR